MSSLAPWLCLVSLSMSSVLGGGQASTATEPAASQAAASFGVLECTTLVVKDSNGVRRALVEASSDGVALSLFDRAQPRVHLNVTDESNAWVSVNRSDGEPALLGAVYDSDNHGATVEMSVVHPESNQRAMEYTFGGMGQEVYGKLSLSDFEGRELIGLSAGGGEYGPYLFLRDEHDPDSGGGPDGAFVQLADSESGQPVLFLKDLSGAISVLEPRAAGQGLWPYAMSLLMGVVGGLIGSALWSRMRSSSAPVH